MFWFLYNVLFVVGYALMLPRFLMRMRRRGGYRKGFLERFAVYPAKQRERLGQKSRIWIHAVSVGEIYVAARFMDEFREQASGTAFILTTTTSTGYRVARGVVKEDDVLLYYPIDFPPIVRRALHILRPEALILTESELWPNMIRLAGAKEIPVVLINGRMSESSYKGYRRIRPVVSRVLGGMDLFLVQTDCDRSRFESLGAVPAGVRVMGSAKYDVARTDAEGCEEARKVLCSIGVDSSTPVVVGGSTWPGEEGVLLDVFKRIKERAQSKYPGNYMVQVGVVRRELEAYRK